MLPAQDWRNLPDSFYEKLIEILTAENASLFQLQKNLEEQYKVLLENRLSDFLRVLEEQKILVWETRQKEEIRKQELGSFIAHVEEFSLKEIIQFSPEKFQQQLQSLKQQFDQRIENIEAMKERNQILIQKSLEVVQQQIQFLCSFGQRGYNAAGKRDENDLSIFNRRV